MSVDPFWADASGETNVLIFGTLYALLLVAYFAARIATIRLGLRGEGLLGRVIGIVAILLLGSLLATLVAIAALIAPKIEDPFLRGVLFAAAIVLLAVLYYKMRVWRG